jgi:hypothetical protein
MSSLPKQAEDTGTPMIDVMVQIVDRVAKHNK